MRTFKADVSETIDLIDFNAEINKQKKKLENEPWMKTLPVDVLLLRTLSSMMMSNGLSSIGNRYIRRLEHP